MKREIVCLPCRHKCDPLSHTDVAAGWRQRFFIGRAQKPPEHNVRIFAGRTMDSLDLKDTVKFETLVCDHCNDSIMDGDHAVAITLWHPDVEGTPGNWEGEYLK